MFRMLEARVFEMLFVALFRHFPNSKKG
jgi:hypothetical protein